MGELLVANGAFAPTSVFYYARSVHFVMMRDVPLLSFMLMFLPRQARVGVNSDRQWTPGRAAVGGSLQYYSRAAFSRDSGRT